MGESSDCYKYGQEKGFLATGHEQPFTQTVDHQVKRIHHTQNT